MIVDLTRNDVSRIARPGTVRVPELFRVERYPTVLQMTSDVAGELDPSVGLAEVFAALFPAGSVTGAPKIRAMRQIAETETTPREIYCGSVGVVEPGGRATFNVAIRTLWIDGERGRAEYGVGGAVTHDSEPERERAEAVSKATVLSEARPSFELLETLRLEEGDLVRLDRHLARLAASARYFGFAPPRESAREALRAAAAPRPDGLHRLRLTAAPDGEVEVERQPFPGPASGEIPRPVAVARELVDRGRVGERRLRPLHLEAADRVWLVNSLREWVDVRLVEASPATEDRASVGRPPGSGGDAPGGR